MLSFYLYVWHHKFINNNIRIAYTNSLELYSFGVYYKHGVLLLNIQWSASGIYDYGIGFRHSDYFDISIMADSLKKMNINMSIKWRPISHNPHLCICSHNALHLYVQIQLVPGVTNVKYLKRQFTEMVKYSDFFLSHLFLTV